MSDTEQDKRRMRGATIDELLNDPPEIEAVDEPAATPPPADDCTEPRTDSVNMRHRREITEQEERFTLERAREQRAAERERRDRVDNTNSERRIAELQAQVARIDDQLLETVQATSTYAEALERELSRVTSENTELKLAQAKLEAEVAKLELRMVERSADRGKVLDLPALPRTVQ